MVKTEKLLRQAGLVSSDAEAVRKIKERAVSLNGTVVDAIAISISPEKPFTVRMGRRVKRVIPIGLSDGCPHVSAGGCILF